MSVRTNMADLITQARLKISDPAGGSAVLTDQQIQDALDQTREVWNYVPLATVPTYSTTGVPTYLTYYAVEGETSASLFGFDADPGPDDAARYWEKDARLYTGSFADVTSSATPDYFVGVWTFASSVNPPLLVVGKTYDLYGACAELLETLAATKKGKVNFSEDGQSLSANQYYTNLLDLAKFYRKKARLRGISAIRTDGGY